MDPLTEKFVSVDAVRIARMQEHLELGHRLAIEIDGDHIVISCSTGHAQWELFKLFPQSFPLPADTCVVDRVPWQMRFRRDTTYFSLLRSDYKESG